MLNRLTFLRFYNLIFENIFQVALIANNKNKKTKNTRKLVKHCFMLSN